MIVVKEIKADPMDLSAEEEGGIEKGETIRSERRYNQKAIIVHYDGSEYIIFFREFSVLYIAFDKLKFFCEDLKIIDNKLKWKEKEQDKVLGNIIINQIIQINKI